MVGVNYLHDVLQRINAHRQGPTGGTAADVLDARMTVRTPPMQDAALIEALNRATSLEQYQLAALLDRLMTDPRRIVAIRRDLHLGQVVRFYDARHDKMRQGQMVEMRDTQLTLQGTEVHGEWKLPYAAIEPPQPGAKPEPAPSPASSAPKPTRADLPRGEKVSFSDRHLQVHVGVITRCNPKTASVDSDGAAWSAFPMAPSGTSWTSEKAPSRQQMGMPGQTPQKHDLYPRGRR